jgi:hypothetical protein
VGYNTDYVMIYFQIFLKVRNMIFNYFSEKGPLVLMCTKFCPVEKSWFVGRLIVGLIVGRRRDPQTLEAEETRTHI